MSHLHSAASNYLDRQLSQIIQDKLIVYTSLFISPLFPLFLRELGTRPSGGANEGMGREQPGRLWGPNGGIRRNQLCLHWAERRKSRLVSVVGVRVEESLG